MKRSKRLGNLAGAVLGIALQAGLMWLLAPSWDWIWREATAGQILWLAVKAGLITGVVEVALLVAVAVLFAD